MFIASICIHRNRYYNPIRACGVLFCCHYHWIWFGKWDFCENDKSFKIWTVMYTKFILSSSWYSKYKDTEQYPITHLCFIAKRNKINSARFDKVIVQLWQLIVEELKSKQTILQSVLLITNCYYTNSNNNNNIKVRSSLVNVIVYYTLIKQHFHMDLSKICNKLPLNEDNSSCHQVLNLIPQY